MITPRQFVALLLLWLSIDLIACVPFLLGEEKKPVPVTYTDDVAPLLKQKCFSCHNPDKKSGDLDLTNYTNLMQGGASGAVIEPGDSGSSYLFSLITHASEPAMPPESPKLPDEMIETVRKWIDGGVLETKSSKAKTQQKKSVDLALASTTNERPAVVALPPRLSLEPVISSATPTAITAIATSPWAPLVAIAGQQQIVLYNTQTLQCLGLLSFPEGVPQVLRFSRNGALLLAGGGRGGASGRVVIWNVATGDRIMELGDELDTVLAADISSDQTLVALGGPQRVVRIYSTESGQLLHEIRKHTDWVCSLEFSPDSVLLATGDRSGGLYVWEGWTGREYLTLKAHTDCVTGVSWRSDSNILASCSEDGSIRLWEMENGGEVKNWGGHGGGSTAVEFTRDGRLVSSGRDRVAKIWGQDGAQARAFEPFADLALRISHCDETNRVIAGDWNGVVRVWQAEDGALVGQLSANPPSLISRRDEAQQIVVAKRAEHQPAAEQLVAATAERDRIVGAVASLEAAAADQQLKADSLSTTHVSSVAACTKLTTELEAATQQVARLDGANGALAKAAEGAAAAAAKLPDDQELQGAAMALQKVRESRARELDEAKQRLAVLPALVEQAQQVVTAGEQEIANAANTLGELMKQLQEMKVALTAAEATFETARLAAEPTATALAAAEREVARWDDEIAFHTKLTQLVTHRNSLIERLTAGEEIQAEQDALLKSAQSEFGALEQQLAEAVTLAENARIAFEAAQQQVATLRATQGPLGAQVLAAEKTTAESTQNLTAIQQEIEQAEAAIKSLKAIQ